MVAWKEYARPSGAEGDGASMEASMEERPKIAIIVTGIGLNSKVTALAIDKLPGQVDLGFSPYGRSLQKWMDMSRQAGHEGFLMIPTEPVSYPENDPGPHTLLAGASTRDNLRKLDWLLSQVTGYVGVINDMGSKFTTSEADVLPILEELHGRGLMFLDARSTRFSVAGAVARRVSMPRAINNLYLDNIISKAEIVRNLTALENTARTYGTALGVARAFPLTIGEIEKWAAGLEARGFQLVPVTAIANRQPIR
ncbi:MAG: divergent polysaccharide deacetylase family protein [Emcibacter sp.]|nr:divergent polysaccharide deacetylase family protein [Emcibacter sp.]